MVEGTLSQFQKNLLNYLLGIFQRDAMYVI